MSWFESYGEDYFQSLFMKDLGRDEAYLRIKNNAKMKPVFLLKSHRECIECDYYKDMVIYTSEVWKVKSSFMYRISQAETDIPQNVLCDLPEQMGEFGVYDLTFNDTNCLFETAKEPVSIYLPMLAVFLIYFGLCVSFIFGMKLLRRLDGSKSTKSVEDATDAKPRLKSLDTFRGLSIVSMIFVNLGAGGYEIFDHAVWNGVHFADMVFPCFLWIMGVCIPISLMSNFKRGASNRVIIASVAIRSIKLFGLGLFLDSGIYLDKFRIMGVLQRFSVCYFFITLICINFLNRSLLLNKENTEPSATTSLSITAIGWIINICIATVHLLIIFLVADQDCDRGYLGPGGLHKHGKYFNCTGGATGYLERTLFGSHIYQNPTSKEVYHSLAFDPEGLTGCLNSIFHTFIGVQAGIILLVHKDHKSRIGHWLSWAVITGMLGGCLCEFSIEDGWIPLNKNLWSLSFVLVTSSAAFLLLTLCYVCIDMKGWWQGEPFFYCGMNSILMYIGHQITAPFFPFSWRINEQDTQTHFLFLLGNVTATTLWIAIAYNLYKIKYFLTI